VVVGACVFGLWCMCVRSESTIDKIESEKGSDKKGKRSEQRTSKKRKTSE